MSNRARSQHGRGSLLGAVLLSLAFVVLLPPRSAAAQLSTSDPVGFFTNLSSRLLQAEFGLNLNQIQIYPTNQYTPAVHRLLQVTANLWETQTTNETGLPIVFRPCFSVTNDAVYVSSYVLVTNDSELAGLPLLDLTASANAASLIPPDGNALLFGVPLVIGARKGLLNFNEFRCEPIVTMTRKLQLRRTGGVITETNQFFIMSITMPQAAEFWNPYATNYPLGYSVVFTNFTTMTLTNDLGVNFSRFFTAGERHNNSPTNWPAFSAANNQSFLVLGRTNLPLQPTIGYLAGPNSGGVVGFVNATNTAVFDDSQQLIMPRWGLTISNRVQAMILRGDGAIIDYVLLGSMVYQTNLTDIISDPPTAVTALERLWATNALGQYLSGRIGAIHQIHISLGAEGIPPPDWASYGTFSPSTSVNEINKFRYAYYNTTTNGFLSVPFTPTCQFRVPLIWQANDPLVHYLPSDLFWFERSMQPLAIKPPTITVSSALDNHGGIGSLNERYRPWATTLGAIETDPDAFNATIKDPLVRSSDNWNFPTNNSLAIETLGQVHRGTPWQTIYLKSSDLGLTNRVASPAEWVGVYNPAAQKWAHWTGNTSLTDCFYTRPVRDWSLVALVASLLNTNDPRQLLSINDGNSDNWLAVFDGMMVLTNTRPNNLVAPAQSETLTMTSNSPQALLLAEAVFTVRSNHSSQVFQTLGDLLATPELTTLSPWLNYSGAYQLQRGISDEAYEKIPSQLLSRVRADSVGNVWPIGATWQIQFTGFDNYPYAVECSTNLVNWTSVSTNYPTNGVFTFIVDSAGGEKCFYRSVLLP